MKFGPAPQHLDIGQSLELIRSRLEILFQSRPGTYSPEVPISVALAGWKWHRGAAQIWPYLAKVVVERTRPVTFRTITSTRYWGWEAGKYGFDAIGSSAEQAKRAAKPIERMTAEELRWVALEKPTEEMTLAELQWISSGEASRTLMKEETNRPARHNFSELKKNRRKRWK